MSSHTTVRLLKVREKSLKKSEGKKKIPLWTQEEQEGRELVSYEE